MLKQWQWSSFLEKLYQDMIGPNMGVLDTNVLGGMVFLFHQMSQEFCVPTSRGQFIFFPFTEKKN